MEEITLSLPEDTLIKLELLAARRGQSISALLVDELEKLLKADEAYTRACQHHLSLLAAASDLGTAAQNSASRDELHER